MYCQGQVRHHSEQGPGSGQVEPPGPAQGCDQLRLRRRGEAGLQQTSDRRAVLGSLRADRCHRRVVAEPSILTRQVNGIRLAGTEARAGPGLQAISRAFSASSAASSAASLSSICWMQVMMAGSTSSSRRVISSLIRQQKHRFALAYQLLLAPFPHLMNTLPKSVFRSSRSCWQARWGSDHDPRQDQS